MSVESVNQTTKLEFSSEMGFLRCMHSGLGLIEWQGGINRMNEDNKCRN